MTLDEIKTVVERSCQLRTPAFAPNTRSHDKIPSLEDYMLASARMRAELEDAWRWVTRVVRDREPMLSLAEGRTVLAREAELDSRCPEEMTILREGRFYKQVIERQVERLRLDEKTVSRAYTFITGQA